jgi:hypothetical protein
MMKQQTPAAAGHHGRRLRAVQPDDWADAARAAISSVALWQPLRAAIDPRGSKLCDVRSPREGLRKLSGESREVLAGSVAGRQT